MLPCVIGDIAMMDELQSEVVEEEFYVSLLQLGRLGL